MSEATVLGRAEDADIRINDLMDSFFRVFPHMDCGFIMMREPGTTNPAVRLTRRREGVAEPDAMGDDRFSKSGSVMRLRIRSMMCAPLVAAAELLGVIQVDSTRENVRFTHDDLELFSAVANQAARLICYLIQRGEKSLMTRA